MAETLVSNINWNHSQDIIFTEESLEEFIRLIRRNGIDGLLIYSVREDLLAKQNANSAEGTGKNGYENLRLEKNTTDDAHKEFYKNRIFTKNTSGKLLSKLQNEYASYFVVVKTNIPLVTSNEEDNIKNGRHTYIKAGDEVTLTTGTNIGGLNFTKNGSTTEVFVKGFGKKDIILPGANSTTNTYVYTGPIKPDGGDDTKLLRGDGQWTNELNNHFIPAINSKYSLGNPNRHWKTLYVDEIDGLGDKVKAAINYPPELVYDTSNQKLSLRDSQGNTLGSQVKISTTDTKNTAGANNNTSKLFLIGAKEQSDNPVTYSNINVYMQSGQLYATKVHQAVFNDYAEFRKINEDIKPGHVVIDNDNGIMACSTTRLQPGAQVISDTYGNIMGETENCKTPIAVAGRVLVYTYQPRENYHAGMAVCSAPNGTVDIMTREEIREYPDCIVGIVSEIPQYEIWGTDNVKVNGRIWITVR